MHLSLDIIDKNVMINKKDKKNVFKNGMILQYCVSLLT